MSTLTLWRNAAAGRNRFSGLPLLFYDVPLISVAARDWSRHNIRIHRRFSPARWRRIQSKLRGLKPCWV